MKEKRDVRSIGVLTSGGDSPGMNAAVRAVARACAHYGIRCIGIKRGYNGLIKNDVTELTPDSVNGIIRRGGTMLYTARCEEFRPEEGQQKAVDTCRNLGIDGLIAIGGDGTFRGALELSHKGIATIGIPGTIDNDIACTQYSIGFDTACTTAIDAADKLTDTMQSHERCSLIEVMGRHAGHLALQVAVAAGAFAVCVPERKTDVEKLCDRINASRKNGRTHFIIIVAEGAGHTTELASEIKTKTGVDTRVTILGHVQRGGTPTGHDRVVATRMGAHAVDLIRMGHTGRIVCWNDSKVCDCGIDEGLAMKKDLDEGLYELIEIVT